MKNHVEWKGKKKKLVGRDARNPNINLFHTAQNIIREVVIVIACTM